MTFFLLASSPYVCLLAALVILWAADGDRDTYLIGVGLTIMSAVASAFMTVLLIAIAMN